MTGRLALATVLVADYDQAIDWYTCALGFELREDTPLGDGRRWIVVAPSGGGCAPLLEPPR